MEPARNSISHLAAQTGNIAKQLVTIGENRMELLRLEIQDEQKHLLRMGLLAAGGTVAVLLAGISLTAAIVVSLWAWSPAGVLVVLAGLYGIAGGCLHSRLTRQWRDSRALSGTCHQLQRDRSVFGKPTVPATNGSHRELLLVESELNRARLAESLAALKTGIQEFTDNSAPVDAIASSAARLVTDLAAIRRGRQAARTSKGAWLSSVVNGAGLVSAVWLALRQHGREGR